MLELDDTFIVCSNFALVYCLLCDAKSYKRDYGILHYQRFKAFTQFH